MTFEPATMALGVATVDAVGDEPDDEDEQPEKAQDLAARDAAVGRRLDQRRIALVRPAADRPVAYVEFAGGFGLRIEIGTVEKFAPSPKIGFGKTTPDFG